MNLRPSRCDRDALPLSYEPVRIVLLDYFNKIVLVKQWVFGYNYPVQILRSISSFFWDIIQIVASAAAIFLLVYLFLIRLYEVQGTSMHPNFEDKDRLLIERVSYYFQDPQRGDVVIFRCPTNGLEYIKRVIGLPSEKIKIEDGNITMYNRGHHRGKVLQEPYLEGIETEEGEFLPEGKVVSIPENQYLVFGDNRPYSSDSRSWGLVPRGNFIGRAFFRYWPPESFGLLPKVEYSDHGNSLLPSPAFEPNLSCLLGEQGVVPPHPHISSGMELGSPLTH